MGRRPDAAVPPLPAALRAGGAAARRGDGAARGARRAPPAHDLPTALRALGRLTEIELARLSREETARSPSASPARRSPRPGAAACTPTPRATRCSWSRRCGRDAPGGRGSRVQAVIAGRLAQLSPPAADLVGVAATIGREFTADVLAAAGAGRAGVRAPRWTSCGAAGSSASRAERLRLQPRQDPRGRLPRARPAAPPPAPPARRAGARARRHPAAAAIAPHYEQAGATARGRPLVRAGGGGGPVAARERRGGPRAGARASPVRAAAGRPRHAPRSSSGC